MIGVDKIGEIRRAYFEQHRSIKEIVRTLSVSRATVRKVVRGKQAGRRSGCSRSCAGTDMTAPTTACIGSSRLGAMSAFGFRCVPTCR
jgi:transposase-like protein